MRVTLVQPNGTYNLSAEVIDFSTTEAVPPWSECALVLGDPASLYVCSDDALQDLTPLVTAHDCDSATYCAQCHRAWRLANTVVTGRTEPPAPVGDEMTAHILGIFHEHIRYPLYGPAEGVELDYHLAAAVAGMEIVRHFRSVTGREVVA